MSDFIIFVRLMRQIFHAQRLFFLHHISAQMQILIHCANIPRHRLNAPHITRHPYQLYMPHFLIQQMENVSQLNCTIF